MAGRKLISSDEAVPAKGQHQKPCSDCPWSRDSLRGWLGGTSIEGWLKAAHGETRIECHTLIGAQCAGAAIYRRNVCKLPVDKTALRLPSDCEHVFSRPMEFMEHHDVFDAEDDE